MPKDQVQPVPAAQLHAFWLSEAAWDLRESCDVSRELVAGFASTSTNSVKRFEQEGAGTREMVARLIAGYTKACGLDDGRELYRRALDLWYAQCDRPLTTESVESIDPGDAWFDRIGRRAQRVLQGGSRRRPRRG